MLELLKHQTQDLKNKEARLRAIFEGSSSGIALLNTKAAFIETNPALGKMLGYDIEELNNYSFLDLTHPQDLDKEMELFSQLVRGELDDYNVEKRFIQKDGNILWGYVRATRGKNTPHIIYMVGDITQRKKFEEEAIRLERLNVAGQMAAGISHEVRNPMTTVRGFLQLLKAKEEYKKDTEYFDLMIEELDRANSIMTEFLNISKVSNTDLEQGNLSEIVNTLAPLIKADALASGKDLEVHTLVVPDLQLNSKEIRQVILNLARNGLEAMDDRGTLIIKTYAETGEVVLSVQDRGKGIPPEVLGKLGTPFLTIKENGTGLGLLNCYSIAHRHNARIVVETGDYGTTFYVRFITISYQ